MKRTRRPSHRLVGMTLALLLALGSVDAALAAVTWNRAVQVNSVGCAWSAPGALLTFGSSGSLVAYSADGCGRHPSRIYLRRRTASGATTIQLSGARGFSHSPSLGGSGRKIDAVWIRDGRVKYRTSSDAGASWSNVQTLSRRTEYALGPRVARDGAGRVAVVWTDYNVGRVRVAVSTDGGLTFGRKTLAVPDDDSSPEGPSVAIAGGAIVVAYSQFQARVYVRRSIDDGISWSPRKDIVRAPNYPYTYAAASGSTVIVGALRYARWSGRSWVVTRRSADAGQTWISVPVESRHAKPSVSLIFSARKGVWRAVYEQCRDWACSSTNLVYRESTDDGMSWSPRSIAASKKAYNSPIGVGTGPSGPLVGWMGYGSGSATDGVYLRTGAGSP